MAAPCGSRWNCRSFGSSVRPVREGPLGGGGGGGGVRPGAGRQQVTSASVNAAKLLEQCPVLGWSRVAPLNLRPPVPARPAPGTRPPGVLYQRGFSSRPWGPSIPVPFPSGNSLLPTVVVSTHCPATSEAGAMGTGPPQSCGVVPCGLKVPTGALQDGESLLCPFEEMCSRFMEGEARHPRAVPLPVTVLDPKNPAHSTLSLRPRVPGAQARVASCPRDPGLDRSVEREERAS